MANPILQLLEALRNMFTCDIGIDLGTANTLVYMKGRGIIIREPSVVAVDARTDELRVRCVGHEAKAIIGAAPNSILAVRPLKDGVIADFDITAATCSENAKGEQPAAPETITLTRKEGSADSIRLMTGVKSPMRLTDSGSGHTVEVAFDESVFTNGVLWQQDAETFVCMEPWNGWANSVNEAGRHIELAPGASKTFAWSITIG